MWSYQWLKFAEGLYEIYLRNPEVLEFALIVEHITQEIVYYR